MPTTPNQEQRTAQLKTLANLLDSRFRGPFGFRFGWDALIGMIPVAGDVVTSSVSLYILLQASALGCSPATLVRMALNIVGDNLLAAIPFVGNVFDFFWKSNDKNIVLLERHLANPRAVTRQSRWLLVFIVLVVFGLVGLTGYATYIAAREVWDVLSSIVPTISE